MAAALESELAGLLSPNLSFSPPADPHLELGPPGCSAAAPPILQNDMLQVAASYHSERLDCGASCVAMSGGGAGAAAIGGGAAGPRASMTAPRWVPPKPTGQPSSGCSASPSSARLTPLALSFAGLLLVALCRAGRRKRAQANSRPYGLICSVLAGTPSSSAKATIDSPGRARTSVQSCSHVASSSAAVRRFVSGLGTGDRRPVAFAARPATACRRNERCSASCAT